MGASSSSSSGYDIENPKLPESAFNITDEERYLTKERKEERNWDQTITKWLMTDREEWDNEFRIEKIARDASNQLYIKTHLEKIQSLLHLDDEDEAMIVGICGPAGIGKTTIARALHSRLSNHFKRTCFMENIRGSYNSGLDEYDLKPQLQEQLLSKVLDQHGMEIYHSGTIQDVLSSVKVLIILDDVDDLKQLEALADETTWFGPGSRIIVITKDQKLLRQHGIDNTYHVDLPSSQEALQILCLYAFRQSYPPNGFQELAKRVVKLCGNLPLSLRLVGSSLDDKKEEDWEEVIRRLKPNMDHRDIEQVLRVLNEPSSSNKRESKSRCFTGMAFFVVINLLLEIASTVADQLSSIRKPYFARISLAMSILSVVLSIFDLTCKVRDNKARFRCKWPMPWFYYPSDDYRRIFGSFNDTVLLFCVVGGDNESDMTKKIAINVLNQLPVSKGRDIEQGLVVYETSSPNKRKSKSRYFTVMAFFVVINLLLEIASTVADQLSTTRKSYFTRISLAMSVLSVVLSILDLTYKIRAHKARFRCKWPIPWFYYPSHDYRRVFGSFTDTVLLFCVVGGLVVSTINYSFMEKGKDGPIKVSLWPLFFAIGMVGAKFMEKPVISKDHSL